MTRTSPSRFQTVLPLLMGLNIAVFLAWQMAISSSNRELFDFLSANFELSLPLFAEGAWWTVITSEFSHIATYHMVFNLYALWIFGTNTEKVTGPGAFLHLYVGGALSASAGYLLFCAITGSATPAVGASGAVMAIAVVQAFLFPKEKLLLFFFLPLPNLVAIGAFIAIDLVGLLNSKASTIAHAAHLGGALYGFLYYQFRLKPRLRSAHRRPTIGGRPPQLRR